MFPVERPITTIQEAEDTTKDAWKRINKGDFPNLKIYTFQRESNQGNDIGRYATIPVIDETVQQPGPFVVACYQTSQRPFWFKLLGYAQKLYKGMRVKDLQSDWEKFQLESLPNLDIQLPETLLVGNTQTAKGEKHPEDVSHVSNVSPPKDIITTEPVSSHENNYFIFTQIPTEFPEIIVTILSRKKTDKAIRHAKLS